MFKLGYAFDLGPDVMPVDLSAAATTGKRVNLRNGRNYNAVLIKGAASAGTDPVLTFNQWNVSSGGSAQPFNPDHFWKKTNTPSLLGTESWVNVAVSTTNGQVTLTGEQGNQGIYVFEVHVPLTQGAAYNWMSVDIAKAGTVAQLGTLIWVPADLSKRYGPANLDPTLY